MTAAVPYHEELIRGEPDYTRFIPHLASYKLAHPECEFIWLGTWWQYFRAWDGGLIVICARSLEDLLAKLDETSERPQ